MPSTDVPSPAAAALDLLDRDRVLAALDPPARKLLTELDLHQQVDSTNAEAMRRVRAGACSGLVCSAEQQLAGRGRRGRAWVSPFASNIYLSLVWEFTGGVAALEGLSLAVGVVVAEALGDCGVPGLQLKWPNDILHAGAKLGGILLEIGGDREGGCTVVIGIGLNVKMPDSAAANIDQNWTDIGSIVSPAPDRNQLLAALLNKLLPLLPAFADHGFAPWKNLWSARDAYAGKAVVVHSGEQQLAGTATGISDSGALLLDAGGTLHTIVGGEVSLRPVA
ncbi:MAG: biotin--[acetyl-CoA-carboxylase] ligase [Halieaceae bacterium]